MKPIELMNRATPVLAFALLIATAACSDSPEPTSPIAPEFAKGGPNAAPTNDGRIFFASRMTGISEIFSINPDGTDLRRLTFTSEEEQTPAVSPDGRKVAFLRGLGGAAKTDLWIMNADGTRQQLVYTVPADVYNIYTPGWTPDGRMITFSYIEANPPNGRRIVSINPKNGAMVVHPVQGMSASWSPDGQYLAYTGAPPYSDDLFISHVDGSDVRNITENMAGFCCGQPAWSPYGDRILFVTWTSEYSPLYLQSVTFGDMMLPTLLNATDRFGSFAWSPDAAKIAASDGTDLFVALANGQGAVKILAGAQAWSGLSWSR